MRTMLARLLFLLCLALAGCGGGGGGGGGGFGFLPPVGQPGTPGSPGSGPAYAIGGSVSGLRGSPVTLRNNEADELVLQEDGPFIFANTVARGTAYKVTVAAQPTDRVCVVVNNEGTANAMVSAVRVVCGPPVPPPEAAPADLRVDYGALSFKLAWNPVPGATYYQLLEDPDGLGPAPAAPVGGNLETAFHERPVSVLRARVNASYVVQACNLGGCGPVSAPLLPDPLRAIGYVKAFNPGERDYFGEAVALSGDGLTLAVGVPRESGKATGVHPATNFPNDDEAEESGAVYIYLREGGLWRQKAYVKASNTEMGDSFGTSVALSGDGRTLAVGAPGEDSNARGVGGDPSNNQATGEGAVYVFARNDDTWSQEAYVKASNTSKTGGYGSIFGTAVALSANGDTLAVGAPDESCPAGATGSGEDGEQALCDVYSAGAVYVFARADRAWSQQAYLKASNAEANDQFGRAVALSADGQVLAVGAPDEDGAATEVGGDPSSNDKPGAGAVYVFVRAGAQWSQQAYVKASNSGADDWFGASVALSADGQTLAVGAPYESSLVFGVNSPAQDNDDAQRAGAAYVFSRSGGAWSLKAFVKASNTREGDEFARALALSGDGRWLAVGAHTDSNYVPGVDDGQEPGTGQRSGAVHLYELAGTDWAHRRYLKAFNPSDNDRFGFAVALSADGGLLAVGAPREDGSAAGVGGRPDNELTNAGAVYLY